MFIINSFSSVGCRVIKRLLRKSPETTAPLNVFTKEMQDNLAYLRRDLKRFIFFFSLNNLRNYTIKRNTVIGTRV